MRVAGASLGGSEHERGPAHHAECDVEAIANAESAAEPIRSHEGIERGRTLEGEAGVEAIEEREHEDRLDEREGSDRDGDKHTTNGLAIVAVGFGIGRSWDVA